MRLDPRIGSFEAVAAAAPGRAPILASLRALNLD